MILYYYNNCRLRTNKMLTRLKTHSITCVYIIFVSLILLRIYTWNKNFDKEALKCENIGECTVTCKIASIPTVKKSNVSFEANVIKGPDVTNKIYVRIKNGENLRLCYGDKITLTADNYPAKNEMNPGNFSYKYYLKSCGICMSLSSDVMRIRSVQSGKFHKLYNLRNRISENLFKYLPYNEASLANALVTGSKNELSEDLKSDFKKSGVYHIVAVSGLHLDIFILFMSYIYMQIKAKNHKKQYIILISNIAVAGFVYMFTGFGVSVARAALMTIILSISAITYRKYSSVHALFAAAAILFLHSPHTILNTSCQLSFLATFGILVSAFIITKYNINKMKYGKIAESLILTFGAWFFTLPVTVYVFGGVSMISFISNLVVLAAAPFALGFSYVFSALSIFMPDFICRIAACVTMIPLRFLINSADFFASIPGAYINVYPKTIFYVTVNLLFIPAFFLMLRKKYRLACSLVFVGIIAVDSAFIIHDTHSNVCMVSFMNVGQGDCTIIQTPTNKAVMIDCGSESENEVAESNILPYMYRSGIKKIDAAIITHYHNDHANGIITLMENNKIQKLYLPRCRPSEDEQKLANEILKTAVKRNISVEFIEHKNKIFLDEESEIDVLSPEKNLITDANNKSLVLMFKCFGEKILFTSDIEENTQYKLLSKNIKADILKIPHHGGKSLLSSNFAQKCMPEYCIISCGVNNSYNHPHSDTLDAYDCFKIYRTDENGMIEFEITEKSLIPKPMYSKEEN